MYGLRSVRRRHVFLIFATIFLVIFLTNNTNAVHRLRRLDIESIDWSNYEEDIISHVKEELNSIVENPEDFLESKKTGKKVEKIEDNEKTTSTEKSTTSATSTISTSSTISSSTSSSTTEKTEKKIETPKSAENKKQDQQRKNEKEDENEQEKPTHSSEPEKPRVKIEKSAQELAALTRQKALENIKKHLQPAKMPEKESVPWVYPTIPAPGEKKKGPSVVPKRFVVKKFLNATNIHIFYRSLPEKTEQRRLLRAYMKMWMSVHSDESMLPMNYSIVTFEDEKTKRESEKFGDLHLCARNSSELEEYTLLMKAVNLATEMNLNETEVAIFAYTTDLVDSSEIASATGKLSAIDSDGQKNMICFKGSSRDTNHYSGCGEKPVFALRGDVVKLFAKEMEIIKPYMGSIEERRIGWLTGIVRARAKIEGLGVNQDNHNLIQMPFELEQFNDFYEDNYDWGMDRKPRKLMDYDLPEIYRKPAEWKIEIEVAPSCDPSPYLYLVKTSRTNIERRNFLRAFQEFDKNSTKVENLPQMRFLLGKGKSSEDPIVEQSIQKEMKKHGDLVIGKFIDEYDNLPHKTMTGYSYFANNCMKPHKKQFVMFIDDDVLLDVEHLDSYLKQPNASDFTCFGFLGEHARPNRWGKYNVTIEQWAGGHFFPKFCSGPCAGMTAQMGEKIYEAASTTDAKGFKLEDVLFTGIIRTKAGIPEPSFQKDVCKHFDQKTKQATQMSMWQYILQLCARRKYMSTIQDQEKLAIAFGLDPNNYVHHKVGLPPGVSAKRPPIVQRGVQMVKPVDLEGKIGKPIYRKPDLSKPKLYQAPKPEVQKSPVQKAKAQDPPPVKENPFAGKNIRIAGKS